jgi:transcriptional regulator with XRE-family HTH domain
LRKKPFDFEPKTLGEQIKKRRLQLGLSQKEVGEKLGVTSFTVLNWEKGKTEISIKSMPNLFSFLGYDPFFRPRSIPERMIAKRRAMGWSIKEAARCLGVDEGTWGAWERGKTILFKKYRTQITSFLKLSD